MKQQRKIFLNWSGGKDSCMALYTLRQTKDSEVVSLLTTVTSGADRISMHGVRTELLKEQVKAIGLPCDLMYIPENTNMEVYEARMQKQLEVYTQRGVSYAAFGDIFLEDLRAYRENNLKKAGITAVFPLWGRDTGELIREFIDLGFKTIITCVDACVLDQSFVGRVIDKKLLEELPEGVDPCGENGEFHTFVFDGPLLAKPVQFSKGEIVKKTYPAPSEEYEEAAYWFIDLIPVNNQ